MKKTFKLEGLDCANCAAKMEAKIAKLNGVNEVSVNFMSGKMILDAEEENLSEIMDKAKIVIHKLEPDVEIKAL